MFLNASVVSWSGGGGKFSVTVSEVLCLSCVVGAVGLPGEVEVTWFLCD